VFEHYQVERCKICQLIFYANWILGCENALFKFITVRQITSEKSFSRIFCGNLLLKYMKRPFYNFAIMPKKKGPRFAGPSGNFITCLLKDIQSIISRT